MRRRARLRWRRALVVVRANPDDDCANATRRSRRRARRHAHTANSDLYGSSNRRADGRSALETRRYADCRAGRPAYRYCDAAHANSRAHTYAVVCRRRADTDGNARAADFNAYVRAYRDAFAYGDARAPNRREHRGTRARLRAAKCARR